jgi:hypothetical protein
MAAASSWSLVARLQQHISFCRRLLKIQTGEVTAMALVFTQLSKLALLGIQEVRELKVKTVRGAMKSLNCTAVSSARALRVLLLVLSLALVIPQHWESRVQVKLASLSSLFSVC